jgi:hypothetical protein
VQPARASAIGAIRTKRTDMGDPALVWLPPY